MKFFPFMTEASKDKNLAIFRKEAQAENDDDEHADDEEPRKPPKRMFSESLKTMIGEYDPEYACDPNKSDLSCLKNYVEANIPYFDTKNEENFKKQLVQLVSIVTSLTLNSTSYMRSIFVDITGFFRGYWLPKGDEKSKPILGIVNGIVHAPEELVKMYLDAKNKRLREKHQDKFDVNFLELDHAVRSLIALGSAGNTKYNGAAWALAIEICTGARKIEILDPNIHFMTLAEYETQKEFERIKLGDPNADFISFKRDRADLDLLSHIIVQVGVAKDKAQAHNKHYEKAGQKHKLAENRPLIKPTVFYDAQFIVDLIHTFRKQFGLTPETFKGRVVTGGQWSTRLFQPLMEKFFPKQFAKAQRYGWGLGSHFGRKLYAAASYKVYYQSVRRATEKSIGLQSWISIILGHMGGIQTQLSYDVIQWDEFIDPDDLKMPNDELVRELQREVLFYRAEMIEQRKLINVVLEKMAVTEREMAKLKQKTQTTDSTPETVDEKNEQRSGHASFKLKNGEYVTIARASRQNRTDEQKQEMLDSLAAELEKHSLKVNTSNLRMLGIGAELSGDYIRKRKNKAPRTVPQQEQKKTAGEPMIAPPATQTKHVTSKQPEHKNEPQHQSREKNKKGHKKQYYELKPGEKIIAPDPKGEKAKEIAHQRDKESFGEENVLENESDCEGTVSELVEVGYKKKRKICAEE